MLHLINCIICLEVLIAQFTFLLTATDFRGLCFESTSGVILQTLCTLLFYRFSPVRGHGGRGGIDKHA